MTTSSVHGSKSSNEDSNARNIFEDPAISAAAQGDPVATFIAENVKTIVIVLVAIAAGMLAYNAFRSTAEGKRAAATQLFGGIRENYDSIVSKQDEIAKLKKDLPADEKAKVESQQKVDGLTKEVQELRQKTKLMIDSLDSPKPFDLLARLYSGLLAARFGEYDAVKSALVNSPWEVVGRPGSAERFVAEIASYGLAKALADSSSEVVSARDTLTGLAERGQFAAVQSVVALAYMADTPDEQKRVRSLIDGVRQRFPAQEKYLQEAGEQVGSPG